MTGGWRPKELDEDADLLPQPRAVDLTRDEMRVDAMLAILHEAARFRRRVTRLLRDEELTFVEWRVLRAMHRALREHRDAVSQQVVARHSEMDEGSVCVAMLRLYQRGLVDIGFDAWGWSQRILLNDEALAKLERAERAIARAPVFFRARLDSEVHDRCASERLDGYFWQ
ncbi:MAG TPA: hypothetical protein VHB79_11730 [Polyangiaceae bacterium]|nr:hypothetical protein [Polyangiaceae bacterium]